jgi:uncharacterized membrane protein YphA (DoxX/SURF4 family)
MNYTTGMPSVGRVVWLAMSAMRLLLGAWMVINGLNHWLPIFPQPMGSFPLSNQLIVTLIETGLFGLVKAVELVGGIMLIADRFVPLALVLLLPMSVVVFYNDAVLQHRWDRVIYMGVDCFYMNVILMLGYIRYYLPMMTFKSELGTLQDLKKLPTIFQAPKTGD